MKDDLAKLREVIIARAKLDEELGKFQRMLAVMVVDMVGTTAYFDRYGDVAGMVRMHVFTDMLLPIVEQHGGTIAKVMGDTILAHFDDPVKSVRAAARIFSALREYNVATKGAASRLVYGADDDIHVRAALNFGLGLVKDKDVFGDVVNMTFRMIRSRRKPAKPRFP